MQSFCADNTTACSVSIISLSENTWLEEKEEHKKKFSILDKLEKYVAVPVNIHCVY